MAPTEEDADVIASPASGGPRRHVMTSEDPMSPDSLSMQRSISEDDSISTYTDYPSAPQTPDVPSIRRHHSHSRRIAGAGLASSVGLLPEENEGLDEESSYTTEDEGRSTKEQSSSLYYDFSDESADDGLWRREVPLLRRGRKTRKQIKQRVDNLMMELQRRRQLFERRRESISKQAARSAKQVTEGVRHQWTSNQEILVLRSRQMSAKLSSGRARAWRHKIVFALVQADFFASAFFMGRWPESYYMYYTAQVALVIGMKVLDYRVKAQHYFLLDFCFFGNAAVLTWLWLFPAWGALFNACEGICGLLALSVVVFRNSCVPHDFVRISNAHVHYPAVLCMLSLRLKCSGDHCVGMEAGLSERWYLRLRDAYGAYLTWAVVYSSIIFLIARKRIDRKQRDTLYKYFADVLGWKDKLPKWLRPYSQFVFMAGHQTMFLSAAWWLFLPFWGQVIGNAVMMLVFYHNGGRFYVDHFWKAYERNTAQYVDAAYSSVLMSKDTAVTQKASRKSGDEKVGSRKSGDEKALNRKSGDEKLSSQKSGDETAKDLKSCDEHSEE